MIILLCGRDQCRLNAHPGDPDSMQIESWSSVDRPLAYVVEVLKQVFDLSQGGSRPIKSYGTRWITRKRKALQRMLDRYGAYIAHLSNLVEGKTIRSADCSHLKGYLL